MITLGPYFYSKPDGYGGSAGIRFHAFTVPGQPPICGNHAIPKAKAPHWWRFKAPGRECGSCRRIRNGWRSPTTPGRTPA